MIADQPQVNKTARYPIGKAAELLQVSRNTLRTHAEEGIIEYKLSKINARKVFTGEAILNYWRAQV